MFRLIFSALAAVVIAGCAPATSEDTPTNNLTPGLPPLYAPRAGDENLARGAVYLDSVDILTMESFPLQFAVDLKGSLPTPCHQLRVIVGDPDAGNRIDLEVYSLSEPNEVCAQVLEPFDQNVYLGSFPAGHYTLWVNGDLSGEFDA